MLLNRNLQVGLILSLMAHGIVLSQGAVLNILPGPRSKEEIKVSYIKNPQNLKSPPKYQPAAGKREPFLRLSQNTQIVKQVPAPLANKDIFSSSAKQTIQRRDVLSLKPTVAAPDVIAIKKKISLPPVGLDKINNPSYVSYYQIVREKIKRAAYQVYTKQETGEVYITFMISNDGYLKDVRLVEEKSQAAVYLKAIALKSVKDASPFPNFPKDLDYPQLSFNVVISFEIE